MQLWSRLKSLARNLLQKSAAESELDEELRCYAETITEEKIAAGMSPAEARRTTLADLGGIEQVKQSVRDHRAGITIELLWQDVRYALRQLRHNRAFTLTAVLTLALGIGATTAIFSAVYALLLRPLPYPDANRLMYVSAKTSGAHNAALGSQDFVAGQTGTKSFEQFAGYYSYYNQNLTGPAGPLRVASADVTANFLPMLGVVPQLGRLFTEDEDRPAGPPVAMISNHLWRTYFHADPAIIGKSIAIDGKSLTIIGVLPLRFNFPDLTLEPDVYTPADLDRDTTIAIDKPMIGIRTIVRLRPGVSVEHAQAELQAFYLARLHKVPAEFRSFFAGRVINPPAACSATWPATAASRSSSFSPALPRYCSSPVSTLPTSSSPAPSPAATKLPCAALSELHASASSVSSSSKALCSPRSPPPSALPSPSSSLRSSAAPARSLRHHPRHESRSCCNFPSASSAHRFTWMDGCSPSPSAWHSSPRCFSVSLPPSAARVSISALPSNPPPCALPRPANNACSATVCSSSK